MSNQNQQGQERNERERGGAGNFKHDQERAREAGRKGGEHSQGGRREKEQE